VKLTIWQFLAIVAALVVVYFVYTMWWSKQSQSGWIRKFNGGVTGDQSAESTTTENIGPDGEPIESTPSPW
jgi:predicted tellurium resistance membrane protein TerC